MVGNGRQPVDILWDQTNSKITQLSFISKFVKSAAMGRPRRLVLKEEMTAIYLFKKFDFPKGNPLQKSNFLKR